MIEERSFKCFLPINPPTVTAQQQRVGFRKNGTPYFYKDQKLQEAEDLFLNLLSQNKPEEELEGPVFLHTKWCFPLIQKSYNGQYKDTRPDTDNLQKLLKDCMTKSGYWKDDAQVASEIIEKFWAEKPGIYIYVQEIQ